jgi:hypothetical protein
MLILIIQLICLERIILLDVELEVARDLRYGPPWGK